MSADLLFEIGCEEIPAKMLARALVDLPGLVDTRLAAVRLTHAGVRALGTPRRLAVIVKGLADRQPDLDEEVVGPPIGAAFAADGTITKAGQGFAAKNGVAPESLTKKEVPGKKGQYVVASRHVVGDDTRKLLPALLAEVAASIAWPKSMRWGWSETAFVRPVQWLVALYGGEVVPVTWAGHTSGRLTRGHRFLSPGAVDVASADAYVETLRAAHVVVDPEIRMELVRAELDRLARETKTRVRPDEALLAEVIHLGEYPVGVAGQFDPSYLEVPEEMIVTAMRNHQRYFALETSDGKLANRFATMMATVVRDRDVVARGNETVLASRLSDAKFFFAEDKKKGSFEPWNERLDGVVFQAKLGDKARTIGDKVRRLVDIVDAVPRSTRDTNTSAAAASVIVEALAIAKVCKADLASHAVGEFPELQGTMGKHYAKAFGLSDAVATGIEQSWWPKGQGAQLPESGAAALVAMADRMDTIVGCFAVGLEPSGSADPFGLRRGAIGIWQILLARPAWYGMFAPLLDATKEALAKQGVTIKDTTKLDEFFKARLRGILVDSGIPPQDADAALAQDWRDPIDARSRALACAKISKEAREVFKRVANILDDARGKKLVPGDTVDPQLFISAGNVEHRLHEAITSARSGETKARADRNYAAVFESLETLRPTVAAFFDKGGVMVMDPDAKLRDNRLALLNWFIAPYMAIADFRLLGGAS